MSRRTIGFVVAGAGAVLVFIATMADLIGISSGGSADMFGRRQIIGTIVGAAILVAGLVAAFAFAPPATTERAKVPGNRRSRRPPPKAQKP